MTPDEEIRRADKAKQLVENKLFQDAFREVEQALLLGIKRTAFRDADLREKLCQQYMLLHNVRDVLTGYIETGKLAEAQLKQQSISERIRAVF